MQNRMSGGTQLWKYIHLWAVLNGPIGPNQRAQGEGVKPRAQMSN